jgi:hypothetical protein
MRRRESEGLWKAGVSNQLGLFFRERAKKPYCD